jgi:hypothetical protein
MLTSSMPPPTGSSSSPISSHTEEIFYTAETPQVLQLAGVNLRKLHHVLNPWMGSGNGPSVIGLEHSGIDWISVQHLGSYGSRQLRLIHNAQGLLLQALVRPRLVELQVNDGDFVLQATSGGIEIPVNRSHSRYFPPGSLQIIVDQDDLQIVNEHTTLPTPRLVDAVPCQGWSKKQHIYVDNGMTEKAVIFFNSSGWPIACRENVLLGTDRFAVDWWHFDYSRPQPTL